jgi:predicted TIM-barrel fold metal-dependent hydrolase
LDFDQIPFDAYLEPKARIAAMEQDGVLASLMFPTFPRFCGQTFLEADDKEVALACVSAYNDWLLEEWCDEYPGRFISCIIVPLWDPQLAADEVRRCVTKGAKSITFSENPSKLGLPSIHDRDRYWDPLLKACAEAGLPLSIHIGSSSSLPMTSPDCPYILSQVLTVMNTQQTLVDWMFSGNLSRFPDLKICLSEGGICWIPYTLERIVHVWDRQQWARTVDFSGDPITGDMRVREGATSFGDTPTNFDPMEIFQRQVFGCMIVDDWGWDSLDYLGCDNVMIETDYPHSDSSFPNSAALASEALKHLSPENRGKILRNNACRVYDFTPAVPPRSSP